DPTTTSNKIFYFNHGAGPVGRLPGDHRAVCSSVFASGPLRPVDGRSQELPAAGPGYRWTDEHRRRLSLECAGFNLRFRRIVSGVFWVKWRGGRGKRDRRIQQSPTNLTTRSGQLSDPSGPGELSSGETGSD